MVAPPAPFLQLCTKRDLGVILEGDDHPLFLGSVAKLSRFFLKNCLLSFKA